LRSVSSQFIRAVKVDEHLVGLEKAKGGDMVQGRDGLGMEAAGDRGASG
jgi:hypothetical protein